MTDLRLIATAGLMALASAFPAAAQTMTPAETTVPAVAAPPPGAAPVTLMPVPGVQEVVLPDGRKIMKPAGSVVPASGSHRCGGMAAIS